jgi:hypothetical protein
LQSLDTQGGKMSIESLCLRPSLFVLARLAMHFPEASLCLSPWPPKLSCVRSLLQEIHICFNRMAALFVPLDGNCLTTRLVLPVSADCSDSLLLVFLAGGMMRLPLVSCGVSQTLFLVYGKALHKRVPVRFKILHSRCWMP